MAKAGPHVFGLYVKEAFCFCGKQLNQNGCVVKSEPNPFGVDSVVIRDCQCGRRFQTKTTNGPFGADVRTDEIQNDSVADKHRLSRWARAEFLKLYGGVPIEQIGIGNFVDSLISQLPKNPNLQRDYNALLKSCRDFLDGSVEPDDFVNFVMSLEANQ